MLNNDFNAENLRKNCEEAQEKKIVYAHSLVEKWSNEMIEASKKGYGNYYIPGRFYLANKNSSIINYMRDPWTQLDCDFPSNKIDLQFYINYFENKGFKVVIKESDPKSFEYFVELVIYWVY